MKMIHYFKGLAGITLLIIPLTACTRYDQPSVNNGFLKEVVSDGSAIEIYTYNEGNLVSEANSTYFWRKYYYNEVNQLVREEIGVDPDIYSSSWPVKPHNELADPTNIAMSMFTVYNYDDHGRLTEALNYVPGKGQVELRSSRTFEYNDKGLIYKELLHSGSNEVTQYRTFVYDNNGNVTEEDYYSYLFIQGQPGPKHMSETTYEYDAYLNPYAIFSQTGRPGRYTNQNNITKIKVINYDPPQGIDPISLSEFTFEYNLSSGYPIRSGEGLEYIYD